MDFKRLTIQKLLDQGQKLQLLVGKCQQPLTKNCTENTFKSSAVLLSSERHACQLTSRETIFGTWEKNHLFTIQQTMFPLQDWSVTCIKNLDTPKREHINSPSRHFSVRDYNTQLTANLLHIYWSELWLPVASCLPFDTSVNHTQRYTKLTNGRLCAKYDCVTKQMAKIVCNCHRLHTIRTLERDTLPHPILWLSECNTQVMIDWTQSIN